jgi:hypothetical protein
MRARLGRGGTVNRPRPTSSPEPSKQTAGYAPRPAGTTGHRVRASGSARASEVTLGPVGYGSHITAPLTLIVP